MKKIVIGVVLALMFAVNAGAQTALSTTTCPGSGCVVLNSQAAGTLSVQIVGTFTGTLQFEQSNDGATWVSLNVYAVGSTTAVTSATAAGLWNAPVSTKQMRIRFSAYTSGTATVYVSTTAARSSGSVFPITLMWPALAPAGTASAPSYSFSGAPTYGLDLTTASGNGIGVVLNGIEHFRYDASGSNYGYIADSASVFGWNSGSLSQGSTVTPDLLLFRDAANTLAQRNGAAAQAFVVYNTTDGTNKEFGGFRWTSNVMRFGTQAVGTGSGRTMSFETTGTRRWDIDGANGHFFANTDNTYDIGAAGTSRPRTGYFGTSVVAPTVNATTAYQVAGVNRIYFVTTDFTTAANTNLQTITGLVIPLPANTALNMPVRCVLFYSQATAAVSDSFGIQTDTVTPSNIAAGGAMETALGTTAYGDATITNTTATAVVTGTPSATATIFNAYLDAFVENPSNASTTNINIMVKTSVSGDAITIKRGSFCRAF